MDGLQYDGETIIEEGVSQRYTPSSRDSMEERDKMNSMNFEQSRVIHAGRQPPRSGQKFGTFGSMRQVKKPSNVSDIRDSIAQMHESMHHDVEIESQDHQGLHNPYDDNLRESQYRESVGPS